MLKNLTPTRARGMVADIYIQRRVAPSPPPCRFFVLCLRVLLVYFPEHFKKQGGALTNFFFRIPIKFPSIFHRFWLILQGGTRLKAPLGTQGGSVSIFHGILMILGCLLGGPGAPLGPLFRPPGPPEPHRRHKNPKKVLSSAQCGARWNSGWIRSGPGPSKCNKNTIKTTCFARVHYRQFSPKRSPRRLPKRSFWRPVEHPWPFFDQLWSLWRGL